VTAGIPDSLGVPAAWANDTLTAVFNDLESVAALFAENKDQVAAVILELVPANMALFCLKKASSPACNGYAGRTALS
jgi:glutamate-1-semialdehyde 2,1-aminomutase